MFTPIRKVGKSEKLLLRWFGPYTIKERRGEVDYVIKKGNSKNSKEEVVHVSRILHWHDPWFPSPNTAEIPLAGEDNPAEDN